MAGRSPLLSPRDLDAPLAWRAGRPLSARQFLADAAAQAARLPEGDALLNLCSDRYRFAVGLAAALLRGQTSLLPPNTLAGTLAGLRTGRSRLHGLVDGTGPASAAGPADAVALPCVAAVEPGAAPLGPGVPSIDDGFEAVCLLTSGSTGAPQPHAKRWRALVANGAGAARRLAALLERPDLAGLNVVATVPGQHSYGLESSILLALLGGAAFDSGRPFYPADIVEALQRLPRPRALVTTPFHLRTLLAAGLALPATELLLSATAPLSPQLARAAERASGGRLIEIYGCTEAGQVATRRTAVGEPWCPFDGLRLRAEPAPDEPGGARFVVHGGHVLEPTALADALQLEADGRFQMLGRANDLIHVAGRRGSLAHLNLQLNSIEGVEDGAFWLPDERADDVVRPVALVVAPGLGAAQLVAALRARLEPVFVPRRVLHVEALPREATGKLSAAALRRFALERLAAAGGRDPEVAQ